MTLRKITMHIVVTAAMVIIAVAGITSTALAKPGLPWIQFAVPNPHGVWCVQLAVNNLADAKLHKRPIAQDGQFGQSTYDWVAWFQSTTGQPVDHIVGPKTGDQVLKYDGSYYGGHNYCYNYVPSTS